MLVLITVRSMHRKVVPPLNCIHLAVILIYVLIFLFFLLLSSQVLLIFLIKIAVPSMPENGAIIVKKLMVVRLIIATSSIYLNATATSQELPLVHFFLSFC